MCLTLSEEWIWIRKGREDGRREIGLVKKKFVSLKKKLKKEAVKIGGKKRIRVFSEVEIQMTERHTSKIFSTL